MNNSQNKQISDLDREDFSDVKKAINNLLWTYLPDSTTLQEAERISIRWWEEIVSIRQKTINQNWQTLDVE